MCTFGMPGHMLSYHAYLIPAFSAVPPGPTIFSAGPTRTFSEEFRSYRMTAAAHVVQTLMDFRMSTLLGVCIDCLGSRT